MMLAGCTRQVDDQSSGQSLLTLRVGGGGRVFSTSQSHSLTYSPQWGVADPTSNSQLVCFAVMINAPELVSRRCYNAQDSEVARANIFAGAVASGDSIQVPVPKGTGRQIYVVGFAATSASECVNIQNLSDRSDLSAPFIIGTATKDLANNTETVNINASLTGATKFFECSHVFGNDGSPPPTPPTVTSITPTTGSASGGTVVLISGANFETGATVKIGGVTCSTSSVTSSSITCTTAAATVGTYDVVVTNPSGAPGTLTAGYGYVAAGSVAFTSPAANSYINASVVTAYNVSGTCTINGASVSVSGDATGGTTCASNAWAVALNFGGASQGSVTVNASLAGGTPASRTFIKDTVLPTLSSLTISPATTPTNDDTPTISGNCNDTGTGIATNGVKVCIHASSCTYPTDYTDTSNCSGSSFTVTPAALAEGTYVIKAVAVDLAGNVSSPYTIDSAYEIDLTTPLVTIDNPTQPSNIGYGSYQDTTFTITNTGPDIATSFSCSVSGSNDYSDVGGTCGTSLSSAATCTKIIRFTAHTIGTANGSLDCDYDQNGHSYSPARSLAATGAVANPLVTALYPTYGLDWLDYVRNNNGGSNQYDQPDAGCLGSETLFSDCIHGGEKRKVAVTGQSTCANLTLTETQNWFAWECVVLSGTATFVTRTLAPGVRLGDLLNPTSWKNNSVTISLSGTTIAQSSSLPWWANTVVALPSNSGAGPLALDSTDDDGGGPDQVYSSGTIFTLNTNASMRGYYLNIDKIAVVTLGANLLTWDNYSTSNCSVTGANGGSNTCMLYGYNRKYLWIEANLNGEGGTYDAQVGLRFGGLKFSRILNTFIDGVNGTNLAAVDLNNSSFSNVVRGLTIRGLQNAGFAFNLDGSGNSFSTLNFGNAGLSTSHAVMEFSPGSANNISADIHIINSNSAASAAILILGSTNKFFKTRLSNTGSGGMVISGGTDNVIADLTCNNTGDACVVLSNAATGNKISHVTALNSLWQLIYINGAGTAYNLFHQILGGNGSDGAVADYNDSVNYFSHIAFFGLVGYPMSMSSGSGETIIIKGFFIKDTGATCGVATGTGFASNCTQAAGSNFTLRNNSAGSSTMYVGKVVTTDSSNASNTSGTQTYGSITDWLNFQNPWRGWGRDGSAYPNTDHAGTCQTGETCRIWDTRISTSDVVVKNKSGDGSSDNGSFTNGSACPSAVHGTTAAIATGAPSQTFLLNALEIPLDMIGDDDGLCETNEACIYSPNFGAYQGEGTYTGNTCTFQNGTISGVTMYAYPANGG